MHNVLNLVEKSIAKICSRKFWMSLGSPRLLRTPEELALRNLVHIIPEPLNLLLLGSGSRFIID